MKMTDEDFDRMFHNRQAFFREEEQPVFRSHSELPKLAALIISDCNDIQSVNFLLLNTPLSLQELHRTYMGVGGRRGQGVDFDDWLIKYGFAHPAQDRDIQVYGIDD